MASYVGGGSDAQPFVAEEDFSEFENNLHLPESNTRHTTGDVSTHDGIISNLYSGAKSAVNWAKNMVYGAAQEEDGYKSSTALQHIGPKKEICEDGDL